jgi:DNA-binding NarL/FixJ family response regulator
MLASMVKSGAHCDSDGVPLRVLIVDDNPLFLDAARATLQREGVSVVGVASSSAEALRVSARLTLDIVLVDISLGEESGLELARRLAEQSHDGERSVVLISTHAEADFADLIAESPARAFLPKHALSANALRRVLDGDSPCEPARG